jgi:predicted HAD superfamily Cof-like phosphohydrolase
MIDDVYEFHVKFGLPLGDDDQLTNNPAAQEFRIKFLQEELDELKEALAAGDRTKIFDALLDLAYVTYGTALFAGISPIQWRAGMRAVHSCNMQKIRAAKAEDSKRGSVFDVKKPEGWVGPEAQLEEILSWRK